MFFYVSSARQYPSPDPDQIIISPYILFPTSWSSNDHTDGPYLSCTRRS